MSYNCVIIDSQVSSCLKLKTHLSDFSDFELNTIVHNHYDGMNMILKYLPDVVFINLTKDDAGDYFKMISELHQYIPKMPIFIGYSETKKYAYEAIKNGFFDYWLFPYTEFDVRKTIFKLRRQRPKEKVPSTICLKTYRDFHYLDTSEILYLQADNNATDFILIDGDKVSAFKTLKSFEETLPKNFIRIHQSYILNSEYVSRINYGKCICSLKNNPREIPFSKSYKSRIEELQALLSNNAIQHVN
ncbi:LytR/AlgR family response regulator transcription factor [uncultured Croceitalea sp.]|uniref:LytR/AlgR family response regulator transcription factor n=1 Tax=uncultured Croceitalea sp. TaxID=1798908 RepID=UPI00374ED458